MPRMKINGPEHKVRIIKAARDLFFSRGYDHVSTDMIAKEARVSKSTLYNHVGDKKAILEAAVTEECKRLFDPHFSMPDDPTTFRQVLVDFSMNLLMLLEDPDIIRFDQVMLSQALKAPDVSKTFYHHAYEATYAHVENVIAYGLDHHLIKRSQSTLVLTSLFMKSLEGRGYQRALYGFEINQMKNKQAHIDMVLDLILGL